MRTFQYILFLLLFSLGITGCTKQPIDNDIEGFWQLESFITNSDGQTHPCKRMYYSITRQVAEIATKPLLHDTSLRPEAFVCRFFYTDNHNKIIMKDFKWREATGDNGKDVDFETLQRYGINANPSTFTVQRADGKNLILISDYATLILKRF